MTDLRSETLDIGVLKLPRLNLVTPVDRTKPIPMVIKVAGEGDEPNCFYAANAETFAITPEAAEAAIARCAADARRWSAEAQEQQSRLVEARTLVDATKIAATEWTGWVCDGAETYAPSVEDFLDHFSADEAPSFCWATYEKGFDFDLQGAIESYLDDEHHEDAEVSNLEPLLAFYEEWKKTANVNTFFPAKEIVVIDEAAFALELAAAVDLLDAASARSGVEDAQ